MTKKGLLKKRIITWKKMQKVRRLFIPATKIIPHTTICEGLRFFAGVVSSVHTYGRDYGTIEHCERHSVRKYQPAIILVRRRSTSHGIFPRVLQKGLNPDSSHSPSFLRKRESTARVSPPSRG